MSSNLKVLVADDNPDHVRLITEILDQELKAEVEGVTKGEECMEKVKKNRYDLLLLDYLFPKISGLDILKEIVEKDYDLPVIMITGHGSEKVAVEAMKAGAIDYIVKSEDGFQSLPFVAKKAIEKNQLRKRLRQSEEKFQNLFESANDAIIYLDRTGRILEVNKQAVEVFGGSKQEVLGKHFTRLGIFTPRDIPTLMSNFADILAGKEVTVSVCFKNKKGQEIALECSASLIKTDDKVSGVMVIARDITERKRAEEALRRSKEYFRLITENASDVVIIVGKKGTITYANPSIEGSSGYKPEELIGKSAFDFIMPADLPRAIIDFGKAILTKETVIPNAFRVRHKNGSERVFEGLGKNLLDNPAVAGFVMNVRDITERRKAEEALRESEQRYKGVVDNIGIGVSLISPNMEILFLNNQMKKWFPNVDISKEAVCYSAFNNPPKEEVCSYCPTYKTLHGGHVHESTTETSAGERIINYRVISSPIKDKDGRVIAAIEMVEDITEKKKLQQQLIQTEKLAAVGTLAYGIAHEFNNILAGMMANAELGLITNDSKQVKECFETIVENTQRASSITNNLLAFARQKEARKELVDITETLRSVLSIIHRKLEKHNIEIVEKFKPIPKVFCDAGQFSEVFLNMITNARDAMLPLGGTLTVQVEPYKDNIRIIFKDTGCGIPDEIKGRIFEAFVTTKGALGGSEVPGTGLGLFLTYGIVDGYQGRIEVESRVGKGTQFTILIPVTKNLPRKRLLDTVIETPEDIEKKLKILLVDDEKAISSSLKKFLESKGHQVTTSLRAKEGLELFKKDKFDLVLSDITIPDMDGIELIKKMRKEDKDAKIIVITGHILKEKEEKAKQAGADEVLIKPFKNEVLCSAISRVLPG